MDEGEGDAVPARVVTVDDTKAIRDVMSIVATAAGLDVVATAEDGREGVEAVRRTQPDAIVLDQEMPELDGLSALPLIRAAAPGATVVMFSSTDSGRVIEQAMAAGAAAFFRKGVDSVADVVSFLCERVRGAA